MSWIDLGEITVSSASCETEVGYFFLQEGEDTLWVKIQKVGLENCRWPWSYGILTWRTANGNELGSIKAYTEQYGEVFRLGVGLPPSERSGTIYYTPRSFNLAWIKKGNPLSLRFAAQSGNTVSGGAPVGGVGAVAGVLADTANAVVTFAFREGLARVKLN